MAGIMLPTIYLTLKWDTRGMLNTSILKQAVATMNDKITSSSFSKTTVPALSLTASNSLSDC
jgi:hypothetical protein